MTEKKNGVPPLAMLSGPELEEFEGIVRDYCAAWTTETGEPDYEGASRFYAKEPEVILYDVVPPRDLHPLDGYPGWGALRPGLPVTVYAGVETFTWTPGELWAIRRGDIAWVGFRYNITSVPQEGEPTVIDGRMTIVFERREEGWLIVHEHSSVPLGYGASRS